MPFSFYRSWSWCCWRRTTQRPVVWCRICARSTSILHGKAPAFSPATPCAVLTVNWCLDFSISESQVNLRVMIFLADLLILVDICRKVLRGLWDPCRVQQPVALHVSHVPAGCFHPELPSRPGHHQPLQVAAGTLQFACHFSSAINFWMFLFPCL